MFSRSLIPAKMTLKRFLSVNGTSMSQQVFSMCGTFLHKSHSFLPLKEDEKNSSLNIFLVFESIIFFKL